MNKKDEILKRATELFATDGYNGVSVRTIARAAGITEGSIYNHYKSKQEILDAILQKHAKELEAAMPKSNQLIEAYDREDWKPAWAFRIKQLESSLEEVDLNIVQILTSEQYRNKQASEIVLKYYIDGPIMITYDLFKHLEDRGDILPGKPMTLARAYQYPLFGMTQEYAINLSMGIDVMPVIEKMKEHVSFFWKHIIKKDFEF